MQWDELKQACDADIQALAGRQNRKKGLFGGSRENNTLTLTLHEGTISDLGMTLISQFPDLKNLSVYDYPDIDQRTLQISSNGWQVLPTCKTLRHLNLVNCPLTIENTRSIGSMHLLESMTLTQCRLTDAHIEQLISLKQLTYLCLNFNPLTDHSIKHLSRLKKLTVLHMAHTDFSCPGASELESSLPDCHVQF